MLVTVRGRDLAGNLIDETDLHATRQLHAPDMPQPSAMIVDGRFDPTESLWYDNPTVSFQRDDDIPDLGPLVECPTFGIELLWQSFPYQCDEHVVAEAHIVTDGIVWPSGMALVDGDAFEVRLGPPESEWTESVRQRRPNDVEYLGIEGRCEDYLYEGPEDCDGSRWIGLQEVAPSYSVRRAVLAPEPETTQTVRYMLDIINGVQVRRVHHWNPDIPSCRYAWNRLVPGLGHGLIVTTPSSWSPGIDPQPIGITAQRGRLTWPDPAREPQSLTSSASGDLRFAIARASAGAGFCRVQWERDADPAAQTPAGQEHGGFRHLNVLRIDADVLTNNDSAFVIRGGFLVGVPPSGQQDPTPSDAWVDLVSSTIRTRLSSVVPDLEDTTLGARISAYTALLNELDTASAGDQSAALDPARQQDRGLMHRLMLVERDARRVGTFISGGISLEQIEDDLASLSASAPETGVTLNARIAAAVAEAIACLAEADACTAQVGGVDAPIDTVRAHAAVEARLTAVRAHLHVLEVAYDNWSRYMSAVDERLATYDALMETLDGLRKPLTDARERVARDAARMSGVSGYELLIPEGTGGDFNWGPSWYMELTGWESSRIASNLETWNASFWAIIAILEDPAYQEWLQARSFIDTQNTQGFYETYLTDDSDAVIDAVASRTISETEPGWDGLMDITGIHLELDVPLQHLAQRLRVDLDASRANADMYDVLVKCGEVHAYPDALSQQYAGANGAHRMKEALCVYSLDVKPVWKNDNGDVEEFKGNNTTSVAIPEISAQVVDVKHGGDGTVSFSVTGTIKDKLSETVTSAQDAISQFSILLNGKKYGDYQVQYGGGSPPWTKRSLSHPFNVPVTLDSIRQGTCVVRVEATNAAGNVGFVNISIPIERARLKGGVQRIGTQITVGLKQSAPDSVVVYREIAGTWIEMGTLTRGADNVYTGESLAYGDSLVSAKLSLDPGMSVGDLNLQAVLTISWSVEKVTLRISGSWPLAMGYNRIDHNILLGGGAARSDDLYLYSVGDPTETGRSERGNFVPILFKLKYKHPLSQTIPTVKINDADVTFVQE